MSSTVLMLFRPNDWHQSMVAGNSCFVGSSVLASMTTLKVRKADRYF